MSDFGDISYSKYRHVDGGVDQYHDPMDIEKHKLQSASNIHIDGRTLYKRPGKRKYGAAFDDPIDGMYEYIDKDGNARLFVKSGSKLYEVGASSNTEIDTGQATERTHFHTLRGKCFYNGANTQRKVDGTTPSMVGIDPPDTAPTVATGASGSLTGSYAAKVSFVIEEDGVATYESDLSPVSNSVTLSSQQLGLTDIPLSDDARVTARYIYRTDNGGSKYWYDSKIQNNTATTASTNVLDANLGDEGETDHGKPTQGSISASANERQFWADGSILRYSENARTDYHVEYAKSTSFYQLHSSIKGLGALYNPDSRREDLYVFLEDSIFILPEGDSQNSLAKASSTYGIAGHDTIAEYDGWLIFFNNKNSISRIRGNRIIDISTRSIPDEIKGIYDKTNCQGAIIFDYYYAITMRRNKAKLYNTRIWVCDLRTIHEVKTGTANATWFPYELNAQYLLQRADGTVIMADTNDRQLYTLSLSNKNDQEADGTTTHWKSKWRPKNFMGNSLFAMKRPCMLSIKGSFERAMSVTPYAWLKGEKEEKSYAPVEYAFIAGQSTMGSGPTTKRKDTLEEAVDDDTVGNTFSFEFESEVEDYFFEFDGYEFTYQTYAREI